jgi:hypothetical protein
MVHSCCINPDISARFEVRFGRARFEVRFGRARFEVRFGPSRWVRGPGPRNAGCKITGIMRSTRISGNMSNTVKRYIMPDTARGRSVMF